MIIGLPAFMVSLAFLLAFWEIQIEGKEWLGSEASWLAYRKGMAGQVGGWTPDNRLPLFYDAVPDCHSSSAVVFCSMELAVRKSAAWLLCRHGFYRRLFVVCFKSSLWD